MKVVGTYNTNSDIIFQATLLKSNLSNYSDTYILVKERIKNRQPGGRSKK